MRSANSSRTFDTVKWLIGAYAVCWVLEVIAQRWLSTDVHYAWFGLSASAVLHGSRLWTLFTYNFLQNAAGFSAGLLTLVCNLLGLYFFGNPVRDSIGPRRFAILYLSWILIGAAAWLAVYPCGVTWPLFGPSASLAGLFALYCCYHANDQVTFLAFFVVPVTMKPKFFCWIWVALDLIGFLFFELTGHPSFLGWNGHVTNLAAMLLAYGYFRVTNRESGGIQLPSWLRRRKKPGVSTPRFSVNLTNHDALKAEVDRILDKINSEGFGALSSEEKRLLDEARDLLSRR